MSQDQTEQPDGAVGAEQQDRWPDVPPETQGRISALWADGRETTAIQLLRSVRTEYGLEEAQEVCEQIAASVEPLMPPVQAADASGGGDSAQKSTGAEVIDFPSSGEEPDGEVAQEAPRHLRVADTPPPKPPRTGSGIIARARRDVSVKLTDEELLEKGRALAMMENTIHMAEAEQKEQKRAMREEMTALEADRTRLAEIVRTGHEVRAVEVRVVADFDAGTASEVRADNGALLITRKLVDDERQLPLLFGDDARDPAQAEAPTDGDEDPEHGEDEDVPEADGEDPEDPEEEGSKGGDQDWFDDPQS